MLSSHPHEAAMLPYVPRPPSLLVDRRYRTGTEVAPSCPRCDSPNTKFCYYNNYSLTQPRYFCKGCRRYWTKGGSLRNVPVGGGCRKNRRGKSSSVRLASDSFSSGGRDAVFGHGGFPGPLRPDMVLEGMVGGNGQANPGQAMHTTADASSIDLAMLYSKFLNPGQQQQTPAEGSGIVGAVTPDSTSDEAFDTFSTSSDLSPGGILAPPQLDGFGEWSGPLSTGADPTSTAADAASMLSTDASVQAALGELNFAMDQSCFDSLGLPTDGAAVNLSSWCSIVPSLSTWEEPKYDSLDSFPDDTMILHDGILAADHDWSPDYQGLEALYMP